MNTRLAKHFRNHPTAGEFKLWQRLRRRQIHGFKFRRQCPIGKYIVDFVCLEKKVVVEVDGGQHARREKKDAVRDAWLESEGFLVLRYWAHLVIQNIDTVAEEIGQALLDR